MYRFVKIRNKWFIRLDSNSKIERFYNVYGTVFLAEVYELKKRVVSEGILSVSLRQAALYIYIYEEAKARGITYEAMCNKFIMFSAVEAQEIFREHKYVLVGPGGESSFKGQYQGHIEKMDIMFPKENV